VAIKAIVGLPLLSWVKCMGIAVILHITGKHWLKSARCRYDEI